MHAVQDSGGGSGFDDYGGELELHKLDFAQETDGGGGGGGAGTLLGKVKTRFDGFHASRVCLAVGVSHLCLFVSLATPSLLRIGLHVYICVFTHVPSCESMIRPNVLPYSLSLSVCLCCMCCYNTGVSCRNPCL